MVRITQTPKGPQLFVLNHRVHHFAAGLALAAAGITLVIHDGHDFIVWVLHGGRHG